MAHLKEEKRVNCTSLVASMPKGTVLIRLINVYLAQNDPFYLVLGTHDSGLLCVGGKYVTQQGILVGYVKTLSAALLPLTRARIAI